MQVLNTESPLAIKPQDMDTFSGLDDGIHFKYDLQGMIDHTEYNATPPLVESFMQIVLRSEKKPDSIISGGMYARIIRPHSLYNRHDKGGVVHVDADYGTTGVPGSVSRFVTVLAVEHPGRVNTAFTENRDAYKMKYVDALKMQGVRFTQPGNGVVIKFDEAKDLHARAPLECEPSKESIIVFLSAVLRYSGDPITCPALT